MASSRPAGGAGGGKTSDPGLRASGWTPGDFFGAGGFFAAGAEPGPPARGADRGGGGFGLNLEWKRAGDFADVARGAGPSAGVVCGSGSRSVSRGVGR